MTTWAAEARAIRVQLQDQGGKPLCGPQEMAAQQADTARMVAERIGFPETVQGTPVTLTTNENEYSLSGSYRDRIRRVVYVPTGLELDYLDEITYRSRHQGNPPPRGIPRFYTVFKVMAEAETGATLRLSVTPEPSSVENGLTLDVYYTLLPSIFTTTATVPLDDGLCQIMREHVCLRVSQGWSSAELAQRQITPEKQAEWARNVEMGLAPGSPAWLRRNQGRLPASVADTAGWPSGWY